jgi:hypothetical protein
MEDGICDSPGECNPEVPFLSQFLICYVILLPLFDQWELELTHATSTELSSLLARQHGARRG